MKVRKGGKGASEAYASCCCIITFGDFEQWLITGTKFLNCKKFVKYQFFPLYWYLDFLASSLLKLSVSLTGTFIVN